MGDIVSLAAMFRHIPEEDGSTIPASLTRPDPTRDWEVVVDPIIGFLCACYHGKLSWSFIKYEAPSASYPRRDSKGPVYRLARIGTTRVGHLSCPDCGNTCVYPVWGKQEETRCPACGHKGVDISYIKETDSEFFELLGDLKDPLEQAVRNAPAEEFVFPNLLCLGRFDPDPEVRPDLQGLATSRGLALRLAKNTAQNDLFGDAMDGDDTGLLLEPGVTAGVLDADKVREGWTKSWGVCTWSVKLPWLPKVTRTVRFGGARL